jgi:hypothetical protein
VKEHLGLDSERSWIILKEVNIFRAASYVGRHGHGLEGAVPFVPNQ